MLILGSKLDKDEGVEEGEFLGFELHSLSGNKDKIIFGEEDIIKLILLLGKNESSLLVSELGIDQGVEEGELLDKEEGILLNSELGKDDGVEKEIYFTLNLIH